MKFSTKTIIKTKFKGLKDRLVKSSNTKERIDLVIAQMEEDYYKRYNSLQEVIRSRCQLEQELKSTPSLRPTYDKVVETEKKLEENLLKMKKQMNILAVKSDAIIAQIEALNSLQNSIGGLDIDFSSYDKEIEAVINSAEAELNFANELIKVGL